MKTTLIPVLTAAVLTARILCQPALAEQSPRGPAANAPALVPLEFYMNHREDLGLSEDQIREIQRIGEGMREQATKHRDGMQERAKALQEAMSQSPINAEEATERFQAMLKAEDVMKALQFRGSLAARALLKPEQVAKLQALAMKENASRGGNEGGDLRAKLQQVRQEIAKRSGGGEPPRELVENLERIQQAAKEGHLPEAKQQLEAMLRNLRQDGGSRPPKNANRPDGASRDDGDGTEKRMRELAEKMKDATPEQREQIEQKMSKLRETQKSAGSPKVSRGDGASAEGNEMLKNKMREIGEAAKHTDDPEVREQLQAAMKRLGEAAKSGNGEAVRDILHSVESLLHGGSAKPGAQPKP